MLTAAAAAAAVPYSVNLGPCSCHNHNAEVSCSTSHRVSSSWIRSPLDSQRACDIRSHFDTQRVSVSGHSNTSFRCKNPLFGATQYFWLSNGQENSLSRISVAADYSDQLPDSSSFVSNNGYHPLEEIREQRRLCAKLTDAEIARTTVEANNRGVLLFPATVHSEPHEQVSWADFQYVIDLCGDIAFEIFDEENILLDHEPVDPVNVLIGMDISHYENRKMDDDDILSEGSFVQEMFMPDDLSELEDSEISHMQVDWGKANSSGESHPVHFSKCLTKVVDSDHSKMMDYPPNGVSLLGYLIPVYGAEELYFQRLFDEEYTYGFASDKRTSLNDEYTHGFASDCRDLDNFGFSSSGCRRLGRSTIYRLGIIQIELLSSYGVQSTINKENFRDAQPDVLVHSMPDIISRFNELGIRFNSALRALCKKKGLYVERAELIGVDSLGVDVRVFLGSEVETHRFPFKVRATSEVAADKQIQQLLFPKSVRKKLKSFQRTDLF